MTQKINLIKRKKIPQTLLQEFQEELGVGLGVIESTKISEIKFIAQKKDEKIGFIAANVSGKKIFILFFRARSS